MKSQITKNKHQRFSRSCLLLLLMLSWTMAAAQNFPVSFEKIDLSCFGSQNGRAAVVPQGGTGPYFFFWPTLSSNDSIQTGLAAGSYPVVIFDAFQNEGTGTVTILEPRPLTTTLTASNVSCFGAQDGSVTTSVTGGTMPYNYAWSNGATTPNITNLDPGPYSVTITDANGCTSGGVTRVTGPPELVLDVFPFNSSCFGSDDGGASASASGGVPPYDFQWSNGAQSNFVSGLNPGIYGVTLTDRVNCQQFFQFIVTEPDSLEFRFQVSDVSCDNAANGSITAFVNGGNPPYNFVWSTGAVGETIQGLSAGIYSVTVFDARQCFNVDSVELQGAAPIDIRLNAVDIRCNGANDGRVDAIVNGGTRPYNYFWSNGGRDSFITDLGPGLYTLRLQDADGCDASIEVNIDEPNAIDIDSNTTGLTCFGDSNGSIEVDLRGGSPPYTYRWSNGSQNNRIENLMAGTYTLTFTDANDCRDSATFVIAQPDEIQANLLTTNETALNANDGTASVNPTNGTPPYSILWSTGSNSQAIQNLAPGAYSVRIQDANDCEVNLPFTIESFACRLAIERDSVEIDSIRCFGGANGRISIKTRGAVDTVFYNWSTGDSTATINNLRAGIYTLIVSDSAFCRDTLEIILPQPSLLEVNISSTNETQAGANDGTASAIATGGTPPYNYFWSNGGNTADIDNLPPATYNLVVTDANGCSATAETTIEPGSGNGCGFSINIFQQNLTCFGDDDGLIRASINGGMPPFNFVWNTGATTNILANLSAGTYSLTVTDPSGCRDSISVLITQPDELQANASATNETTQGANDGTATANPNGGTPPYEYNWSTGAMTQNISNLAPGTYELLVTDANGCDATQEVTVEAASGGGSGCGFTINVNVQNARCFGSSDGQANASITGGIPPFQFSWSNGATTAAITGLAAGTYSLTVTNLRNCRDSITINIDQPTPLNANLSSTDETFAGANDGSAMVSPSGGTPTYSVLWSNGATSNTIVGLSPGSYGVTIADQNDCRIEEVVRINPGGGTGCGLDIFDVLVEDVRCFGGQEGRLTAFVTGGVPPFSYSWSNGASGQIVSGLGAGTYSVTASDANGCVDSASVLVNEPNELQANLATTNESQPNASDGAASVSPAGGTPPYAVQWSTGGNQNSITDLEPGSYSFT
ncbi:MAG: SprB repeat-containing protein, partial [Bacteroidota bacterium]